MSARETPSANVTTEHLVSVSIVSHGQIALVSDLLNDLSTYCDRGQLEVVLTLNVPEEFDAASAPADLPIEVVINDVPKGFGANHNAAFRHASGQFFCVMNPDVRLRDDPFPALVDALGAAGVGVAGPKVVSPQGTVEDSGRVFPTPIRLIKKLWHRGVRKSEPEPDYPIADARIYPDWIGGMCMLFRSVTFERIGGFDERYFLYYEDVDLCWRLQKVGLNVVLEPAAQVVHEAHRSSWTRPRYLRWHLTSMLRFLVTSTRG